MKKGPSLFLAAGLALLLTGCAGQTTDPRQGGLFSYNPQAYEQRLQDRREHLTQVEQVNREAETESAALESERVSRQQEKAALERQVRKLSSSIVKMEKAIKAKRATTTAQQKKQQRILAELNTLKAASRKADNIEDPEEKRLELNRLQQRRDQLEKEAASLMRL
jgi:septal ring factor EnvC (AmiA/AmiB activator)